MADAIFNALRIGSNGGKWNRKPQNVNIFFKDLGQEQESNAISIERNKSNSISSRMQQMGDISALLQYCWILLQWERTVNNVYKLESVIRSSQVYNIRICKKKQFVYDWIKLYCMLKADTFLRQGNEISKEKTYWESNYSLTKRAWDWYSGLKFITIEVRASRIGVYAITALYCAGLASHSISFSTAIHIKSSSFSRPDRLSIGSPKYFLSLSPG